MYKSFCILHYISGNVHCVLVRGNQPYRITREHTPNNEKELKRVIKAGLYCSTVLPSLCQQQRKHFFIFFLNICTCLKDTVKAEIFVEDLKFRLFRGKNISMKLKPPQKFNLQVKIFLLLLVSAGIFTFKETTKLNPHEI